MHPVFQESVHFPTEHYCLGLRLQPLTVGHLFLLRDIGFPVDGPVPVHRDLLLMAAMICAQPYPNARALVYARRCPISACLMAAIIGWLNRRTQSLYAEFKALCEYIAFHRRFPDVSHPTGTTRSIRAPVDWRFLRFLMRQHPEMSFDQALNTPLLRCAGILAVDEERDGNLDLEPWDPARPNRLRSLWEWAEEEDRKRQNN